MTTPQTIATAYQAALLSTTTLPELVATFNAFPANPAIADAECELWAEDGVQMSRGHWLAAMQGAIAYKAAYGEGVQ
jgi:hypothetical protein